MKPATPRFGDRIGPPENLDFEAPFIGMKALVASIETRPSPWFFLGVIVAELMKATVFLTKIAIDFFFLALTEESEYED